MALEGHSKKQSPGSIEQKPTILPSNFDAMIDNTMERLMKNTHLPEAKENHCSFQAKHFLVVKLILN